MEKWKLSDIEVIDKASGLSLPSVKESKSKGAVVILDLQQPSGEKERERLIHHDEKEQTQHPERSGITKWRIPEAKPSITHLQDKVVYETDDETDGQKLSFYEVTHQRDQSLYEKVCCSSDVIRVWNEVSHYIKRKIRQGSGVTIPGLCTFTQASTKRLGVGSRYVLRRKPVLAMSKSLVKHYKLIDPSEHIFGFRVIILKL